MASETIKVYRLKKKKKVMISLRKNNSLSKSCPLESSLHEANMYSQNGNPTVWFI